MMKTVSNPRRFKDVHAFEDDLADGLKTLTDVQGVVSAMVKDAVTTDHPPPVAILTYGYALIKEISELMDELGWKPWKPRKPIDIERAADEFADVLAFLGLITIYVMQLTGLTHHDLAVAYLRKSDINMSRFKGEVEGYKMNGAQLPLTETQDNEICVEPGCGKPCLPGEYACADHFHQMI